MKHITKDHEFAVTSPERLAPPEPMALRETEADGLVVVRMIRRRFGAIAAVTLALTLLALPFILTMEPKYVATTRLLIQLPGAQTLVTSPTDHAPPLDLDVEIARIGARGNIEAVIAQLGLAELPEFNVALEPPSLWTQFRELIGSPAETEEVDEALGVFLAVREALDVRRSGSSSVIELSFEATDPVTSAAVANALVDAYLDLRNGRRRSDALAAHGLLIDRRARQSERYDAARAAARSYQEEMGLASDPALTEVSQTLAALGERVADLQRRRSVLQEQIVAAEAARAEPLMTVEGEPDALALLREGLRAAEDELTRARSLHAEGDARVSLLALRSQELREKIAGEMEIYRSELSRRLQWLEDEIASVEARIAQQQGAVTRQSGAVIELASLLQTAEAEGKVLGEIDRQLHALNAELSIDAVEVEVLAPATPPTHAEGRGRKFYLAAVLFASGLLALTIAGLRDIFDTRVRSEDDITPIPGVSHEGALPLAPKRVLNMMPVIMQRQSGSFFADSAYSLLRSIEAEAGDGRLKSLVVTSAARGDGVTTVATALALALVKAGRRVLLVTCEAPKPTCTGSLGKPCSSGELSILREKISERITVDPWTGLQHLQRTLPGAGFFPSQSEMAEIAALGSTTGTFVIFDAPPVLDTPTARLPAGMADRTLLVVRWGRTRRRLVALAAERLNGSWRRPVMTVLNGLNYRLQRHYRSGDAEACTALAKLSRT